jgi:hypothetical protein
MLCPKLRLPSSFATSLALAFVLATSVGFAQDQPGPEAPKPAATRPWKYGAEFDVSPYITGGYYAGGFVGHQGWKFRVVATRFNLPSFLISSGFRDKRTDAYALLADHFWGKKREELAGFWVGGGFEYWRSRIRTETAPDYAHFNNVMLTGGGGYAWHFAKHFYLNPYAGGHFVIGGNRDVPVSGKTYTQPVFTPEASVKIGIIF